MRTTIDLPDDLHRIVTSLARHTGRSLGQTAAELMRRGLAASEQTNRVGEATAAYQLHPLTGLPVVASRQPVTEDDIKALDDEP
jgi:negative regulator of replication initiation